jgi:hypothetical protein
MVLKPKEFGGIPFLSEESAPWSIVRVGPYLNFCLYTAVVMKISLVFLIFWLPYFGLFQVKVQFIFKCEVDYIVFMNFGLLVGILLVWNWIWL